MAPSPPVRAAVISRSRRWRSSWRASSSSVAGVASSWPARRTISGISSASSGASPMTEAGCSRWPRRRSAARRVSGEVKSGVEVGGRRASPRPAPAGRRRARGTRARTARGGRAPGARRWPVRRTGAPARRAAAGGPARAGPCGRRSRRDPALMPRRLDASWIEARRAGCPAGSGLMTAPTCRAAPRRRVRRARACARPAKRANGTARVEQRAHRARRRPPPPRCRPGRRPAAAGRRGTPAAVRAAPSRRAVARGLLARRVGVLAEQHQRREALRAGVACSAVSAVPIDADRVGDARPGAARSRRCSPRRARRGPPCAAAARARSAP